jgi:methylmalonyl-CoA mutase N-terminal domain/subunit
MLQLDPEVERSQLAFLERLKAERSTEPVQAALDQLAEAAAGANNLLPALLTATEARATLGEVCNVLRQVWGEYNPPVTL